MAKKKKFKLPRDWLAVHAHFKKSGALGGNPKKKESKEECRKCKKDKGENCGQ